MRTGQSNSSSSSSRSKSVRGPLNRWSQVEDDRLVEAIAQHGTTNWSVIAASVGSKTTSSCYQRWHRVVNPTLAKGPFSPDEYRRLTLGLVLHGEQWAKIADMLPGRTDTQCRARWVQIRRQKCALYKLLYGMIRTPANDAHTRARVIDMLSQVEFAKTLPPPPSPTATSHPHSRSPAMMSTDSEEPKSSMTLGLPEVHGSGSSESGHTDIDEEEEEEEEFEEERPAPAQAVSPNVQTTSSHTAAPTLKVEEPPCITLSCGGGWWMDGLDSCLSPVPMHMHMQQPLIFVDSSAVDDVQWLPSFGDL